MTQKVTVTRVLFFLLFLITLSFSYYTSYAQDEEIPTEEARISEGESLFKGNCQSCHKVHEKLVGQE